MKDQGDHKILQTKGGLTPYSSDVTAVPLKDRNRRQMLSILAASAAASLLPTQIVSAQSRQTGSVFSLAQLDEAFAAKFIGSRFEFWNDPEEGSRSRSASATLVAVTTNSYKNQKQAEFSLDRSTLVRSFNLEFRVDESTPVPPDALCHVMHDKLGYFELFVQTGRSADNNYGMRAIFTRI